MLIKYVIVIATLYMLMGESTVSAQSRLCSEMGCLSGLTIAVPSDYQWKEGNYRFAVTLDGKEALCIGSLPFTSCNGALTCSESDIIMITESGCASSSSDHGFGDITLTSSPKALSVRITRDETVIAEDFFTPSYLTVQPNGKGCEPTCTQAHVSLFMQ